MKKETNKRPSVPFAPKFEFPNFAIEYDPSLEEVVPKEMEHRKEFAKCSTRLQLQHLLSMRGDLAGAVMVQRAIQGHEEKVLSTIKNLQSNFDDELKELRKTIDGLPSISDIECKVDDKLKRLKDEGVVDASTLAIEITKDLNEKYELNKFQDLCGTLRKAYGGEGRVTKAVRDIEQLLSDAKRLEELIERMPDEEKIAKTVVEREKDRFDQVRQRLAELYQLLDEMREETIRKAEKAQAIIEGGEQEFEREATAFVIEEWGSVGRYQIIDKRTEEGAIGRKTGDLVMRRNGQHNYTIVIDWKKTNPNSPHSIPLSRAVEVAENSLKNRKADASIVCVQSPEQLPQEANGIYIINHKEILTHFGLLRLAVELLETFIEFERRKELEGDIDIRRVTDVIERLRRGNSPLETTIRSLKRVKGALETSLSRLIDYQQQVASAAIRELEIIKKVRGKN